MEKIVPYDIGSKIDDTFEIVKWIGYGGTSMVAKCVHIESGHYFALKIYNKSTLEKFIYELFELEIEIMKNLESSSITKILAANKSGILIDLKLKKHEVIYIVTELAENGSLSDYILYSKNYFSEKQVRKIFQKIVVGVHYLHKQSITHRDLKTSNILIDKFFEIKISDFGFSKKIDQSKNSGLLKTFAGTNGYMSPQILNREHYNGFLNDVFSLGVILFIMINKIPPFKEATYDDKYYSYFYKKDYDKFWKIYEKRKVNNSNSLRDLLNGMLKVENRFSLEDVMSHEWYKQDCENDENYIKQMIEIKQNKENLEDLFLMKAIQGSYYKNEQLEYRNLSISQKEFCNSLFEKIGFTTSHNVLDLECYSPKYSFLYETNDFKDVSQKVISLLVLAFGINCNFTFDNNSFSFTVLIPLKLSIDNDTFENEEDRSINNHDNSTIKSINESDCDFEIDASINVDFFLDKTKKRSIVLFSKSESLDLFYFNHFFETLMNSRELLNS